jgi:hypothetical protein
LPRKVPSEPEKNRARNGSVFHEWECWFQNNFTSVGIPHKSMSVKRFQRRKATKFDKDHPNVDLNCRCLMSSIAINAV